MADIARYYIILQMSKVPSNIIILVDLTQIKKSHRNKKCCSSFQDQVTMHSFEGLYFIKQT